MNKINAFGTSEITNYNKLLDEFGVDEFKGLPDPLPIMRRNIVFGERDLNIIRDAISNKKRFAVMTGIKPSNYLHIGSKLIVDELVYFQKHGGIVYYTFADIESLVDNGLSYDEASKKALDNLIDLVALGLDLSKAKVYLQSRNKEVMRHSFVYSRNVTNNMLKSIYGDHPVRMYMAALTQVADILLPQIELGRIPVVVPVGFDQDPHIRLTRDIAKKHGLIPPSSIYHKFMPSLLSVNKKMSKREPNGVIYLNEDVSNVKKKIMKYAFSGGRDTVEEHRRLGGNLEVDVSYQYLRYFLDDDKRLNEIADNYTSGKLLSGELKKILVEVITEFLINHQRKREKVRKSVEKYFNDKVLI